MDIAPEMKELKNDHHEYRRQTADMNEYHLYAALLEYHIPWLSPFVIVSGRIMRHVAYEDQYRAFFMPCRYII